jgi:hypothetical protein
MFLKIGNGVERQEHGRKALIMCFASAPLIRLPLRSIRFRLPFFLLRMWPRLELRLVDSPEAVILKRFLIPL